MTKKNIILIMTDQFRPDYVGYGKNSGISTPGINRVAEGISFSRCQTPNPICLPARSALITGRYSHQVGALAMSGELSLQYPTFPRALQKAGYTTSLIGKLHLMQAWNFATTARGEGYNLVKMNDTVKKYGFDHVWEVGGKQLSRRNYCEYCEYLEKNGVMEEFRDFVDTHPSPNRIAANVKNDVVEPFPLSDEYYVDNVIGDKVIEFIENQCSKNQSQAPFFLQASFCCPHTPIDPPKSYLEKEALICDEIIGGNTYSDEVKNKIYELRRAYRAMIKLVDHQISRIFETLEERDLLKDTVVIFSADHGDTLGDHNYFGKSLPYYQSAGIPCAIRHPDYPGMGENSSPISLIDIAATILDIAGLDNSAISKDWPDFNDRIPAKSLMPIISGERDKVHDYVFSECDATWYMIISENYKYIKYPSPGNPDGYREELFELNDKPETVNLIDRADLSQIITWHCNRLNHELETTPCGQTNNA
ncbi:MAG: sulfatase-like hydrolase/transferase [Firmicutes bacterium]|nr:sulfatase-like hydrolase/transferase [Bacillota bacterium]